MALLLYWTGKWLPDAFKLKKAIIYAQPQEYVRPMKSVTPTELRGNLDNLLDEILSTGIPLEIERGGQRLRIIPVEPVDKLQRLVHRPDVIQGDPEDLVNLSWEKEVNLDLP